MTYYQEHKDRLREYYRKYMRRKKRKKSIENTALKKEQEKKELDILINKYFGDEDM